MKWYFTFMQSQEELRNKFVCIEGTFEEARMKMFERYGSQWAFQYSEEVFKGQAQKYNLEEIPL